MDKLTQIHRAADTARETYYEALTRFQPGDAVDTYLAVVNAWHAAIEARTAATDPLEEAFIAWQDERTEISWCALVAAWQDITG